MPARTMPPLRPVAPAANAVRSSKATRTPSWASQQQVTAPSSPPPTTATSTVDGSSVERGRAAVVLCQKETESACMLVHALSTHKYDDDLHNVRKDVLFSYSPRSLRSKARVCILCAVKINCTSYAQSADAARFYLNQTLNYQNSSGPGGTMITFGFSSPCSGEGRFASRCKACRTISMILSKF